MAAFRSGTNQEYSDKPFRYRKDEYQVRIHRRLWNNVQVTYSPEIPFLYSESFQEVKLDQVGLFVEKKSYLHVLSLIMREKQLGLRYYKNKFDDEIR